MAKLEIEVGRALEEAGRDFIKAWEAAEAGQSVEPMDRISFQTWETCNAVLTPKRIALLKAVRREPAANYRALAQALGRDVKNVHGDVKALRQLGMIEVGDDGRLSTSIDEITATVTIAA